MIKIFSDWAWEDYLYWQKNDKRMLKKVNELLKDIDRNQYDGIGKPEPLKYPLSGFWSRRVSEEHRLIYRIQDDEIHIAQIRYHY
jgi:toxin YoeB